MVMHLALRQFDISISHRRVNLLVTRRRCCCRKIERSHTAQQALLLNVVQNPAKLVVSRWTVAINP